jgi:glycerol-3-phosphate cytidylyltransferase
MKRIYVGGTFDCFHPGHVKLLENAKNIADEVIVAVNSDEFVKFYKKRLPIMNQHERLIMVQSCKYTSEAFIMESFEKQPEYIINYNVDYILHGDDWTGDSLLEQLNINHKFLLDNNIEMKYVPYTKGISTTNIKGRIIKSEINEIYGHLK